jgi:hypothetical protein
MNVHVGAPTDIPLPESPRANLSEWRVRRLERDTARGYSINVKQVVLAFAVEFVIIGLILANQSAIAASLPKATWMSIIMGTSMPIALAMAELARVPLAICVRTQPSWNIKLVAVAGVMAAVVVTSVNLSLIGWNTYEPRLEEVNQKRVEVLKLEDQKNALATQIAEADSAVQQRRSDRDSLYEQQKGIQQELNKHQNVTSGQTRTMNQDGTTTNRTVFAINPAIAVLKKELDGLKPKVAAAEAALKQTEAQRATYPARQQELNQKISTGQTEYREAINRSQLHAYAAMLFGKDADKLTDGEVKTFERYLIWIPAIAAALSSTLIAMTAVRRIKTPKPQPTAVLPENAAGFLFNPLLTGIEKAAADAVTAAINRHVNATASAETGAMNGHAKATAPPGAGATNGHAKASPAETTTA